MKSNFNDHFSDASQDYSKYRPHYPSELFTYLASICHQQYLAWDCATGSGQAAFGLAEHFDKVIATDASCAQIDSASKHKANIHFNVATAEQSHIKAQSVDLISVAQALHWFDIDAFSQEVKRVLKPDGILCAWTYNLLSVEKEIDQIIKHLYGPVLDKYWPDQRMLVENDYRDINLPFNKKDAPRFEMTSEWTLDQLIGYLRRG